MNTKVIYDEETGRYIRNPEASQTTEGQIGGEQKGRWETNRGRWCRQNEPETVTKVGG